MSEEQPGRKPKKQIEDMDGDNFYVMTLKHAMNEKGLTVDEALALFKQQTADAKHGSEHLDPMDVAAEVIRSQLKKKK